MKKTQIMKKMDESDTFAMWEPLLIGYHISSSNTSVLYNCCSHLVPLLKRSPHTTNELYRSPTTPGGEQGPNSSSVMSSTDSIFGPESISANAVMPNRPYHWTDLHIGDTIQVLLTSSIMLSIINLHTLRKITND
jgi:hypothetical protein